MPARLVFYFTLVLCLFPAESYRSAMKILMAVFGRGMGGYRVPTTGSIGAARRRLGSGPMETAVRAVMAPRARPETLGGVVSRLVVDRGRWDHVRCAGHRGQRA